MKLQVYPSKKGGKSPKGHGMKGAMGSALADKFLSGNRGGGGGVPGMVGRSTVFMQIINLICRQVSLITRRPRREERKKKKRKTKKIKSTRNIVEAVVLVVAVDRDPIKFAIFCKYSVNQSNILSLAILFENE